MAPIDLEEVLPFLAWFGWLSIMAVVLVLGAVDVYRHRAWYSACAAAGAALHMVWMASMGAWSAVYSGVAGGSRSLLRALAERLELIGVWAFLLGTLLLIVGGLAFYLAYPRLPPMQRKKNDKSSGDEE